MVVAADPCCLVVSNWVIIRTNNTDQKGGASMALANDKEVTKDILVQMIEAGLIKKGNFPDIVDAVCDAYKEIFKTVKED